jgi:hypothetical protein
MSAEFDALRPTKDYYYRGRPDRGACRSVVGPRESVRQTGGT